MIRKLRSLLQRPFGVLVLVAILTVTLVGGTAAWLLAINNEPTQVSAPQTPNDTTSTGVRQYSPEDSAHQRAVTLRQNHPEYYRCRQYPADADLKPGDLIPTDNVVAFVRYDPRNKKFTVQGDTRIAYTEQSHIQQPTDNHDFTEPTLVQDFNFSFAPGVLYFNTYGAYASEGKWNHAEPLYHSQAQSFKLETYVAPSQKDWDQYVVVATDTKSCAPGSTPLPDDFWTYLAKTEQIEPELYDSAGIYPQGQP